MVIREQAQLISAAAFWELSHQPEYADKMLELVEGVVVEMSRPGGEHGVLQSRIGAVILSFVENHSLGHVTTESGYILFVDPITGKDTVRGPYVGFVRLERAPDGLPAGYIPFPPDLAVEVVLPNDMVYDIDKKVADYRKAGVPLVWVIYPLSKRVIVHTLEGDTVVNSNGVLDGGDVLPGFTLPLTRIFPN